MQSQCIFSVKTPVGPPVEIIRHTFASQSPQPTKRVSILAGLHGDEFEGLHICHRLLQILKNLEEQNSSAFKGEINIYPAVNPQALETGTRLWPFFANDINRTFGGKKINSLPDETSRTLFNDLKSSSDLVIDIHSSNLYLMELPQIRIIKSFEKKLAPLAKLCNVDLIWIHPHAQVFESTLGYNLNQAQIPTLVIETGTCLRINKHHCAQIVLGTLNLLRQIGVLDTDEPQVKIAEPRLVKPEGVTMVQASGAGLFIKKVEVGKILTAGEIIGTLIDPISGKVQEEIRSPCCGLLFTLREHPLTAKGSPLARIAKEESA